VPSDFNTNEKIPPVATAITLESPGTCVGVGLGSNDPLVSSLPSWPLALCPNAHTVPSGFTTNVCRLAEIVDWSTGWPAPIADDASGTRTTANTAVHAVNVAKNRRPDRRRGVSVDVPTWLIITDSLISVWHSAGRRVQPSRTLPVRTQSRGPAEPCQPFTGST
jgi:hypothetical protein